MKLTPVSALSTLVLLSGLVGCSSGDDDDGTGGTSGTGGTAQAGTGGTGTAGSGGSSGATAGTSSGGGGAGGGTAGGTATDSPSDATQAGLEAFLAAKSYRNAAWASDEAAPHAPVEATSPHGRVQVWFNGTLRTAAAAAQTPRPPGSMVVKELYDSGTNVVGHAVLLRSPANNWIYYCSSSEPSRCFPGAPADQPTFATTVGSCSCHGAGTIITPIPAP